MVEIVAYKNGFVVKGHAGYGEAGNDIVCSAITAITQTAMLGLQEFCDANTKVEGGFMGVHIDRPNRISIAIIQTMLLGLYQIQNDYPDYIKIAESFVWRIFNGNRRNND